jgi:hypothetical protein
MLYQVSFNLASGKGRGRTKGAYRMRFDAQRYADVLNVDKRAARNARVVIAKKGTYDRIV